MDYKKLCFVGQAPSATSDPLSPLSGTSGMALAEMANIPWNEFLGIARFNLNSTHCASKLGYDTFDYIEGRVEANRILALPFERFVLVGARVGQCFTNALRFEVDRDFLRISRVDNKWFLYVPHPSGLNRWYNSLANKHRCQVVLTTFCAMSQL